MRMWVHGEPGACVVVTVGSLIREDFIDGVALVGSGARIGLGGCDGLGQAVVARGGLVEAVSGWPWVNCQVSSITVQYADCLPW